LKNIEDIVRSTGLELPQGEDLKYSPDSSLGGHIETAQAFKFVDRPKVNASIVNKMKERRKQHKKKPGSVGDKSNNLLIALPASPGSGKSAMLANFPASDEWLEFCEGQEDQPIVSTLTWNSDMTGGCASLGLRILYGAMRSHGFTEDPWKLWEKEMLNKEPEAHKLQAYEAASLLRNLLGESRPVLILVDELSKTDEYPRPSAYVTGDSTKLSTSEIVAREIGEFLDTSFFVVDEESGETKYVPNLAVISSLSPDFIKQLYSTSQRPVQYVPLPPLLDANLAADVTEDWAKGIRAKAGGKVDKFALNALKSLHLLMSGHPRSLQYLRNSLTSTTFIDEWREPLTNALRVKQHDVFANVLDVLLRMSKKASTYFKDISPPLFEHGVLSTVPIKIGRKDDTTAMLRIAVEEGQLFLVPTSSDTNSYDTSILASLGFLFFLHSKRRNWWATTVRSLQLRSSYLGV
jgi:hypothetical protein